VRVSCPHCAPASQAGSIRGRVLLEYSRGRASLTLCTVGCWVQERREVPQVLTRDHRMDAWQLLGPPGVNGDETDVGIRRTQNGAVEGPRWEGQSFRVDGPPRDFGHCIHTWRLPYLCPHGCHKSSFCQQE